MEKAKKILLISSLSCLGVTCLLLILAIFQVKVFEGFLLRLLLVCACLSLSCGFLVNELSLIKRNSKLGYASMSLLLLSTVFALIIFCSNLLNVDSVFNKITIVISLFSIFFMIIVSFYTKMGKNLLWLQIITYVAILLTDILLSCLFVGIQIMKVSGMSEIFWILCIVSVCLLVSLGILSSKKTFDNIKSGDNFVTISKEEYENLLKENEDLKRQLGLNQGNNAKK